VLEVLRVLGRFDEARPRRRATFVPDGVPPSVLVSAPASATPRRLDDADRLKQASGTFYGLGSQRTFTPIRGVSPEAFRIAHQVDAKTEKL
jgi:hypothetical protein